MIDRLFTYARGAPLSEERLTVKKAEGAPLEMSDVAGVLAALDARVTASSR